MPSPKVAFRPALRILGAFFLLVSPFTVRAWEDHDQLTALALVDQSFVSGTVIAESLETFLETEKAALVPCFAKIETRARKELAGYPPLPKELVFKGGESGAALRASFMRALRVNPKMPFPLFVQTPAWSQRKRPPLPLPAVDLYQSRIPNGPFEELKAGEKVAIREVFSAASDEPDYGMDIGLYEDTGTEAGKSYGFGKAPYGNPALSYGSQAAFHMAFPDEDPVIKLAAPFTKRSLLPYRVMLYEGLARLAFERGRDYWAWRFAGWAVHYIEDMTQPYHASILPGMSPLGIIWLNAMGSAEAKRAALVLISNRHILVEDYLYGAMAAYPGPRPAGAPEANPVYAALRGITPFSAARLPPWRDRYEYDVLARRAYGRGRALDRLLGSSFPAKYVSDPGYDYGRNSGATLEYDPYVRLRAENPSAAERLDGISAELFADLGEAVRAFAVSVRAPATAVPPRKAPLDLRIPLYSAILVAFVSAIALLSVAFARRRKIRLAAG